MDKALALVTWLSLQGEMEFTAFVNAARSAGLDPQVWHAAKRRKLLVTEIRNGVHYVRAVA